MLVARSFNGSRVAREQQRHVPVMRWLVDRGVAVDTAAQAIATVVNDVLKVDATERQNQGARWRSIKQAYLRAP